MGPEARRLAAGFAVLGLLALYVAARVEVATDITHFLPDSAADARVSLARQLATGSFARQMVLMVESEQPGAAVYGARALEDALRADPHVMAELEFLEGGPPADFEERVWRLYEPHRLALLADDAEGARAATSDESLALAARRLESRLALPISGLVSQAAPSDPLLILPAFLERLRGGADERLRVEDGRFVSADGGAAVLFLATHAPSSAAERQRVVLAGIERAFEDVARASDAPLALSMSGVNRFALRSETAIRADIERVSIGSTIGLALLLLVLFRSLRLPLLVLPVVTAGFLCGTSACLLAFGSIHGLTLAFGAGLIGVSVDYAVHFYAHQLLAPSANGARATLASLWRGLALGAATTCVGFATLLVSGFPGLRELAVFALAGLAAALFATRVFLPGLVGTPRPTAALSALAARIGVLLEACARRPAWLALPTLAAVVVSALGLPGIAWNDALSALDGRDPELEREDRRVRERILGDVSSQIVIAVGADDEAALRAGEECERALVQAVRDGLLSSWRGLATVVPSAARQREVDGALRADASLWPRLLAALEARGFRGAAFEPFRVALAAEPPEPLSLAAFEASPLASLARPFRVPLKEGVGLAIHLRGVSDPDALGAHLAPLVDVHLIDVERDLSHAYGAYRQRMTTLLGFGLAAVFALVALRYRSLRLTLCACVPALLAVTCTLGALSLVGAQLNLLTLVALLMVGSMGVDYGVMLVETRGDARAASATHLSVLVAGSSTLLGFVLLALSSQPALRTIGTTAALGIGVCLGIAPTLGPLLGARRSA